MSIFKIVLLSATLLCIGCQQESESFDSSADSSVTEKELRSIVLKIAEDAVDADTLALRSIHYNSPKFSKFGPRIAVRQDVESTNKSEAEHFLSIYDANLSFNDIKVDVFGDVAVTTFYNNYSFIKNNIRVQGKARVTFVFLRTKDGWKIVHEHSSPFNP